MSSWSIYANASLEQHPSYQTWKYNYSEVILEMLSSCDMALLNAITWTTADYRNVLRIIAGAFFFMGMRFLCLILYIPVCNAWSFVQRAGGVFFLFYMIFFKFTWNLELIYLMLFLRWKEKGKCSYCTHAAQY